MLLVFVDDIIVTREGQTEVNKLGGKLSSRFEIK